VVSIASARGRVRQRPPRAVVVALPPREPKSVVPRISLPLAARGASGIVTVFIVIWYYYYVQVHLHMTFSGIFRICV
jgi:hypothetical protein